MELSYIMIRLRSRRQSPILKLPYYFLLVPIFYLIDLIFYFKKKNWEEIICSCNLCSFPIFLVNKLIIFIRSFLFTSRIFQQSLMHSISRILLIHDELIEKHWTNTQALCWMSVRMWYETIPCHVYPWELVRL